MFSLDQRNQPNHFKRMKEEMTLELRHVEGIIWSTFETPVQIIYSLENNRKVYPSEPKLKDPTNRLEVLKYGMLRKRHLANRQKFEADWSRLYSIIWEKYCGDNLKIILKDSPDFESKVKNNPLKLLERIEILMSAPDRVMCPVHTKVAEDIEVEVGEGMWARSTNSVE